MEPLDVCYTSDNNNNYQLPVTLRDCRQASFVSKDSFCSSILHIDEVAFEIQVVSQVLIHYSIIFIDFLRKRVLNGDSIIEFPFEVRG